MNEKTIDERYKKAYLAYCEKFDDDPGYFMAPIFLQSDLNLYAEFLEKCVREGKTQDYYYPDDPDVIY